MKNILSSILSFCHHVMKISIMITVMFITLPQNNALATPQTEEEEEEKKDQPSSSKAPEQRDSPSTTGERDLLSFKSEKSIIPRGPQWGLSEEEIDYLFKHSKDLVCIVEFGGHFKRLNKTWGHLLGWETQELLEVPYINFVHLEDVERTLEYEKNFTPAGLVNRYRCKDGSYRWLDWIGLSRVHEELIKGERGHPLSIARDITLQKSLEKRLDKKLKNLKVKWYTKQKILEAITEIQASHISSIFSETEQGGEESILKTILQNFIQLSESDFGFIDRVIPSKSKKVETKTWQANPRLNQEAYQRFKLCQAKVDLLNFNMLLEQIISQKKPLIINNIQEYFKDLGLSQQGSNLRSFLGLPLTSKNEIVGILALANRSTDYNAQLLEWFEPLSMVTGRILNEANLIRSHQKVQKAYLQRQIAEAKIEAKSAFLAHMSHELKTPLSGLIGLLDLIDPSRLDDEEVKYFQLSKETAASLLTIINDILDLSRIEEGKLTLETVEFNLLGVSQDVIKLLSHSAKNQGLKLNLKADSEIPDSVIGDPTRLRQILLNLVGNAIKFTKRGKVEVVLDGHYIKGDTRYLLSGSVKDTGIGMSAESVARLFQPFSQADESMSRRYEGTGMGLYITKSLCELMGGRIIVQSKLGKGSNFQFEINLGLPKKRLTIMSPHLSESSLNLPPLHILVAEDNRVNQLLLKGILERMGCRVMIVPNGLEAIKAVEQEQFDLILMDGQMPEMDGLEATRKIREHYLTSDLPIIGVTAHAMVTDKKKFIDAGMNGFLTKPVNKKILYDEILRCLKDKIDK